MSASPGLWTRVYDSLPAHPKTRKLARILDIPVPTAIGHLVLLWTWALDYAPDGDLSDHDPEDVAAGMAWERDPEALLEALVSCAMKRGGAGFLERTGERLLIHDWDDYGGRVLAEREAARERARKSRDRSRTVPERDHDEAAAFAADETRSDEKGRDETGVPARLASVPERPEGCDETAWRNLSKLAEAVPRWTVVLVEPRERAELERMTADDRGALNDVAGSLLEAKSKPKNPGAYLGKSWQKRREEATP